jgi:hypothetical protein
VTTLSQPWPSQIGMPVIAMPGSRRLDPVAVAALLRRRWKNGHRRWLDDNGDWPLTILLHPPTERETTHDLAGVRAWVESWAAVERDPDRPGELIWAERQWPGLGRQRLPGRLLLAGAEAVAAWAGEYDRSVRACERGELVRRVFEMPDRRLGEARVAGSCVDANNATDFDFDSETDTDFGLQVGRSVPRLARHFDWLADAPAADFERLLAVLRWLIDHPDSGLYIRQLPIPGIDTKWIGANRGRLVDLLAWHQRRESDQDRNPDSDLHQLAGLRREPDVMRLRILDPALRAAIGGLGDITAPVEQIAELPLAPKQVFIVENLQTGLAFDDLPGTVCFMARGYAVEAFAAIPWLHDRPCHYWGDLDTHGFAILNRLRRYLPDVRSLLMDADTLLRHRDLWQREDKPAAGPLERLTTDEQAVFEGLLTDRWGERVRLEQERIDWGYAWEQVCGAHKPPYR